MPILYSFRRCPYAMRARLALAASGERHVLREIVLRDKPAAMLAASPKGTVPVLVTADGPVIDQSLEIMLWTLRRHDPLRWLPPDAAALADAMALTAACDGDFKQQLDRYKYPDRHANAPVQTTPAREHGAAFLSELDTRLTRTAHLSGTTLGLVDAALLPFVRQFAMVDADWFAAQAWPRLRAWLGAWTDRPLFMRVMAKHPVWVPGAPPLEQPAG